MDPVDVLGLSLKEALQALGESGEGAVIRMTGPDSPGEEIGTGRVVKADCVREQWTLTVCSVPDAFR